MTKILLLVLLCLAHLSLAGSMISPVNFVDTVDPEPTVIDTTPTLIDPVSPPTDKSTPTVIDPSPTSTDPIVID